MWKPSCKTHKTLAQRAAEQRSNAEGGRRKKKEKKKKPNKKLKNLWERSRKERKEECFLENNAPR